MNMTRLSWFGRRGVDAPASKRAGEPAAFIRRVMVCCWVATAGAALVVGCGGGSSRPGAGGGSIGSGAGTGGGLSSNSGGETASGGATGTGGAQDGGMGGVGASGESGGAGGTGGAVATGGAGGLGVDCSEGAFSGDPSFSCLGACQTAANHPGARVCVNSPTGRLNCETCLEICGASVMVSGACLTFASPDCYTRCTRCTCIPNLPGGSGTWVCQATGVSGCS